MTSELSDFSAQLRAFIAFQAEEPTFGLPRDNTYAEQADAGFNRYALLLFGLQFKANAAYRKLCGARGITPDAVTHWTQIPALPTTAFKELEITSLPPELRTNVFHSSGTTEQKPSRHFHNAESLAIYEASLWPWFVRHVVPNFRFPISDLRPAILSPPPSRCPHSSLVHMFEAVRRKLGATESSFLGGLSDNGEWILNLEAVLQCLRYACETQNPLLLLGTAFSFVHLLDFLAQKESHFELPPGSRVMETGGYKGRSRLLPKSQLHALITDHLGIQASHIVCEYGMSELSSQAYGTVIPSFRFRDPGTVHSFRFPPWARAKIISPETGCEVSDGEMGLIRVFDLANVFSVMAIQTEDLAVRRGDGFNLIGRAQHSEPRGCSLMVA